jgi:DNA-binding transcriptional LysR family regulator
VATHLEPAIGRFHEVYSDILLDVTIDDSVIDIVKAGFDVGIRPGELLENDIVAFRMGGRLRQLAVASPEYLARYGVPKTPSDVHRHAASRRQPGSSGQGSFALLTVSFS